MEKTVDFSITINTELDDIFAAGTSACCNG